MIFEVVNYRAKLLGEAGNRIVNPLMETRVSKGFVVAENEVAAAERVGLVQLHINNGEHALQESLSRCYFPRGTTTEQAMHELEQAKQSGWSNPGMLIYVISRIVELGENHFAK